MIMHGQIIHNEDFYRKKGRKPTEVVRSKEPELWKECWISKRQSHLQNMVFIFDKIFKLGFIYHDVQDKGGSQVSKLV